MAKISLRSGIKSASTPRFYVPKFKLPFWRNDYMYPSKPGISHADNIVNLLKKLSKGGK